MAYVYPFTLEPEADGSAVNIAFPDVPGARTFGADETEARALAEDCLIAALGGYIELGEPIPNPSPAEGRPTVALPPLVAAKLALYETLRAEDVSPAALAERLGITEAAVHRLLDLDHRSHLDRIEAALRALGEGGGWRSGCATRREGYAGTGTPRAELYAGGHRPRREGGAAQ